MGRKARIDVTPDLSYDQEREKKKGEDNKWDGEKNGATFFILLYLSIALIKNIPGTWYILIDNNMPEAGSTHPTCSSGAG